MVKLWISAGSGGALLLLLAVAGLCSQPVDKPTPIRLVVEAEDFTPTTGDWEVREWGSNYYASTLAVTFLSRQRYLSAPEQGVAAAATREIEIPRDGTYECWARFEQPYDYSVEFDVAIEQGGKTVFERPYGRRDAPKLWAFGEGLKAQVLFPWGPGDNVVWEGKDSSAVLKKGKAKITLKKGPQQAKQSARRNVDALLLTDDSEGVARQMKEARYLPLDGWLTQSGDVFLTVTNPPDAKDALTVVLPPCTEHSPYWVHVRDWPPGITVANVAPGAKSPTIDVGQLFDTLNQFQWKVELRGPDGQPAPGRKAVFTFAVARGDQRTEIHSATYEAGPDGKIHFFLDGDLRRTRRIRTVEDDLKSLRELLESFPKHGRTPERFPVFGLMGTSPYLDAPGPLGDQCRAIAMALGSNTLRNVGKPERNQMIDVRHVATKDLAAHCDKLKADGMDKRLRVVSLGDEIHVAGKAKSPDDDPAFRRFLQAHSVNPADLGLKTLDEAKIEMENKESRLYYHSHLFAMEQAIAAIKERTDLIESKLGKEVRIGANYSPHPYYWPKEGQWLRLFRRRAMTLPWSEDYVWQVPEASPQIVGYLLAALRAGAVHHDLPIHFYVMPHFPGTTADNLRRSWYTALGHGAKHLDFFCATPLSAAYTENYVQSEAKETWRTIHDLVRELGAIEHVAYEAKTRPAETALLLSFAQDLWDPDPAYNHERKCLYLAHRLAGYGMDVLSEEDVQSGRHKQYKAIYVVGNHLERATAQLLKSWVHDDGRVLVGVAGGAFRDEFNQPMDLLYDVYGITSQNVVKQDPVIMTKQQLPRLKPMDRIHFFEQKKNEFNALGIKMTYKTTPKAQLWAKYADGSPAISRNDYGKGVGLLFGSLLASEYFRQAIPLRPFDRGTTKNSFNQFLPQDFDGHLSDIVTSGAGAGEARWDVITDNPMVESTVLEGPNGLAVTLVNWTNQPQDLFLTVQFVPRGFDRVTSVASGPLRAQRTNVTVSFKLRVDVADVVLLEQP